MSDGKRITLRLTMGERTYELLWEALTNQESGGQPDHWTAADSAAFQRLMTSVVRQKNKAHG